MRNYNNLHVHHRQQKKQFQDRQEGTGCAHDNPP